MSTLKDTDPERYAELMARLDKARTAKAAKAEENKKLKASAKAMFAGNETASVPAQAPVEAPVQPPAQAPVEAPVQPPAPAPIAESNNSATLFGEDPAVTTAPAAETDEPDIALTKPVSTVRIPAPPRRKKSKVQKQESDSSDSDVDPSEIRSKYREKYKAKYSAIFEELRSKQAAVPAPAPQPEPPAPVRMPAQNPYIDFQRASTALARQTIAKSLNEEIIKATMRSMFSRI